LFGIDDYANLTGTRIIYEYNVQKAKYTSRTVSFSPKFARPHQQIIRFDQDNDTPPDEKDHTEVIKRIALEKYDVGLISDYSHGGVTREIIKALRASSKLVLCDPKGTDPYKYGSLVDILTPNLQELGDLTSSELPDSTVGKLMSLGGVIRGRREDPISIVLKRSEEGCILYRNHEGFHRYDPHRNGRNVIDPTGAGDTFIAMLAFSLAQGSELREAVNSANWLAGVSVTYPNCWVPTEEECLRKPLE